MDCRNPGYKDVLGLPSLALDTRFPAGMTAFVYKGMALTQPGLRVTMECYRPQTDNRSTPKLTIRIGAVAILETGP